MKEISLSCLERSLSPHCFSDLGNGNVDNGNIAFLSIQKSKFCCSILLGFPMVMACKPIVEFP